MYTFLNTINVDRTFHYETHFVKNIDYNYKLQERKTFCTLTSENVDNCKQPLIINYIVIHMIICIRDK